MPEASQPENLGQLSKVFYHKWKSLAEHKGAEASVFWVREAQMGADSRNKDMDHETP